MKKSIETKKVFVAALILTLTLFISPLSSFGGEGCVYRHAGDIEGLLFDFGPGLPLALPGLGEVTVLAAEVLASGREMVVVTPFDLYIYHARLWAGWEGSENPEKGIIYADTAEAGTLAFEFESARLFERFMIVDPENESPIACEGGEITVPEDVNLFFGVKGVTPYGMPEVVFNLILKIKDGIPVIIKVW